MFHVSLKLHLIQTIKKTNSFILFLTTMVFINGFCEIAIRQKFR